MAEEGIVTTRASVTTTFKTVTPSAFMIPEPPGVSAFWDGGDVELVNRDVAGAPGEVAYPPIAVGSRRTLTALVFGDYTPAGVAVLGFANCRSQLKTNMKHLVDNVVARVTSGAGTLSVQLLGPGGSSIGSAAAQVVGPLRPVWHSPISMAVTLDFWFPQGVIAL